ncbi:hypothetical protein [Nocardiopsis baichengensis]|uniref:hypothetical protein n=1 Tax=Nocardiopsis baichengensis TaxID=280240 RepID=UPI001872D27C|nr:hypothetical protein [Nocardiopsis baichengensis]
MQVSIRMTAAEEAAFRAEHALEDGDSTRACLIDVVIVELGGLGDERRWWDATAVRCS